MGIIHTIKEFLRPYYYLCFVLRRTRKNHLQIVDNIRKKGYANVVFFAANLPMWRYQGIYEKMSSDPRFNTKILLTPFKSYSELQKEENIKTLRTYFDSKGIPYEDTTKWSKEKFSIREWFDPDIMFYTQAYGILYGNELDSLYFHDKLLCFVPYGVGTGDCNWAVNTTFQNVAWKLFYETDVYHKVAKRITYNHGKNVVVVGNTNADEFLKPSHSFAWKEIPQSKKIIWAPHFSIEQNQLLHRDSFLWLYDVMPKIAQEYSGRIQFVFKPHPRLRTVLYQYPGWGRERTDKYYERWATMPNSQYENSSFVDLFMTSDAMIHDCCSFMVEYHYCQKPCLFTTRNMAETRKPLNEFGLAALDAHYIGETESDVRNFIDNVVLGGNDSKRHEREVFFNKYLLPPNGRSVAQNIYDDIVKSIWGK